MSARATRHWMSRRAIATFATAVMAIGSAVMIDSGRTAYGADLVVTTLDDVVDPSDGELSLREAVESSNTDPDLDSISFEAGLTGRLTMHDELAIVGDVEIIGPGRGALTIDISGFRGVYFNGLPSTPLIRLDGSASLKISDLTLEQAGGNSMIYGSVDELTVQNVDVIRGRVDVEARRNVTFDQVDFVDRGFGSGIEVRGSSGDPANPLKISVIDTTIADGANGIQVYASADVVLDLVAISHQIGAGAHLHVDGNVSIVDSSFAHNGQFGLRLDPLSTGFGFSSPDAAAGYDIRNVTITDSGEAGVFVELIDDSVSIADSTLRGNANGIEVRVLDPGREQRLEVTDTLIADSTVNGVRIDDPSFPVLLERVTVDGTGYHAVFLNADRRPPVAPPGWPVTDVRIVNSTITGISPTRDLPIVNAETPIRIEHTTIVANGAPGDTSVVFDGGNIDVDHTIAVTNNGRPLSSGATTFTNSLVPIGALVGPTNIETDGPRLAPLAATFGALPTFVPFADSPATDRGNLAADEAPATDQRGRPRVVGTSIDIGAVERQPDEPLPVDVSLKRAVRCSMVVGGC